MATPIGTAAPVTARARTTVVRTASPKPGEPTTPAKAPPSVHGTSPRRSRGEPTSRATRTATTTGTLLRAAFHPPPRDIGQPPKTCWYSPRIASLSFPIAPQSGATVGAPAGLVGPGTPGRVG